jgi:hypothetical protein
MFCPTCAWPWRHTPTAADGCRALARLHDTPALQASVREWDYETDFVRSAGTTLATELAARTGLGVRHWRRIGDLKCVVGSLPAVRARWLLRARVNGLVHLTPGRSARTRRSSSPSICARPRGLNGTSNEPQSRPGGIPVSACAWRMSTSRVIPPRVASHDFLEACRETS